MAYTRPEALRGTHVLSDFRSGEESLDRWLRRHARPAQAGHSARVFVATELGTTRVVGYHALAAGSLHTSEASSRLAAGQPAGRRIPVILLARLAVDRRHQGVGLGRSLLQDAMLRANAAADEIGARALTVNALDETARRFYQRFGFEPSPTDRHHLILLMKDLRRFIAAVESSEKTP